MSQVARMHLCLYVAGQAPNSVNALANLRQIIPSLVPSVSLEIIDVLVEPARCLQARVIATPLLVRVIPKPERRILGDLRDRSRVLATLIQKGAPGGQ